MINVFLSSLFTGRRQAVLTASVLAAGLVFSLGTDARAREPGRISSDGLTVRGLRLDARNPLRLGFVMTGEDVSGAEEQIRYFLTALTVPGDDLWVNLAPEEADRVLPPALLKTDLGQVMLRQDFHLKQTTAGYLDPDSETGRLFWQALSSFHPGASVDLAHRVWIVPEQADVYEEADRVYVVRCRLGVRLQNDIPGAPGKESLSAVAEKAEQIFREQVLPKIERDVNESPGFAPLRRIFHNIILATWYKQTLKESILTRGYADRRKMGGLALRPEEEAARIYETYIRALTRQSGSLAEEYDPTTQTLVPRHYFTGGVDAAGMRRVLSAFGPDEANPRAAADPNAILEDLFPDAASLVEVRLDVDPATMAAPPNRTAGALKRLYGTAMAQSFMLPDLNLVGKRVVLERSGEIIHGLLTEYQKNASAVRLTILKFDGESREVEVPLDSDGHVNSPSDLRSSLSFNAAARGPLAEAAIHPAVMALQTGDTVRGIFPEDGIEKDFEGTILELTTFRGQPSRLRTLRVRRSGEDGEEITLSTSTRPAAGEKKLVAVNTTFAPINSVPGSNSHRYPHSAGEVVLDGLSRGRDINGHTFYGTFDPSNLRRVSAAFEVIGETAGGLKIRLYAAEQGTGDINPRFTGEVINDVSAARYDPRSGVLVITRRRVDPESGRAFLTRGVLDNTTSKRIPLDENGNSGFFDNLAQRFGNRPLSEIQPYVRVFYHDNADGEVRQMDGFLSEYQATPSLADAGEARVRVTIRTRLSSDEPGFREETLELAYRADGNFARVREPSLESAPAGQLISLGAPVVFSRPAGEPADRWTTPSGVLSARVSEALKLSGPSDLTVEYEAQLGPQRLDVQTLTALGAVIALRDAENPERVSVLSGITEINYLQDEENLTLRRGAKTVDWEELDRPAEIPPLFPGEKAADRPALAEIAIATPPDPATLSGLEQVQINWREPVTPAGLDRIASDILVLPGVRVRPYDPQRGEEGTGFVQLWEKRVLDRSNVDLESDRLNPRPEIHNAFINALKMGREIAAVSGESLEAVIVVRENRLNGRYSVESFGVRYLDDGQNNPRSLINLSREIFDRFIVIKENAGLRLTAAERVYNEASLAGQSLFEAKERLIAGLVEDDVYGVLADLAIDDESLKRLAGVVWQHVSGAAGLSRLPVGIEKFFQDEFNLPLEEIVRRTQNVRERVERMFLNKPGSADFASLSEPGESEENLGGIDFREGALEVTTDGGLESGFSRWPGAEQLNADFNGLIPTIRSITPITISDFPGLQVSTK